MIAQDEVPDPKQVYKPDLTYQNVGICQTEQTRNRHWPDGRRDQNFFQAIDLDRPAHPLPLSVTQVGLANTCLGLETTSLVKTWIMYFCIIYLFVSAQYS